MSKFCIQPKLHLRPKQHHHAHINDGKSTILYSAAKSNRFLGIDGFFYNSFYVCTTLMGGGLSGASKLLPSVRGGKAEGLGVREKVREGGRDGICDWWYLVSLRIGKNVSGVGWLCVPAAYLLMLVSRKEQSQTTGGSEPGGGTERPRAAACEREHFD